MSRLDFGQDVLPGLLLNPVCQKVTQLGKTTSLCGSFVRGAAILSARAIALVRRLPVARLSVFAPSILRHVVVMEVVVVANSDHRPLV